MAVHCGRRPALAITVLTLLLYPGNGDADRKPRNIKE